MAERIARARLERALDEVLAHVQGAPMPAIPYERIAGRIAARARVRRRRTTALGATAAVLIAVAVWRLAVPPQPAGFAIATASAALRYRVEGGRVLVVEAGQAALEVKELATRIELDGAARLAREDGSIRVQSGRATFEVARRETRPLAVLVSGGRIEVLGTRFTVTQREGSGEVALARGSIRFRAADGREAVLHPGDRLQWPLPPVTAPPPAPAPSPPPRPPDPPARPSTRPPPRPPLERRAPEPPQPTPALAPEKIPTPAEAAAEKRRILTEIDRLRIQADDAALARRLDELLAEDLGEPLRELVSFERCDVLTHRSGEETRACAAIAQHLARYGSGEFAPRLLEMRGRIRCGP